jgi:hypothetical protein
VQRRGAGDLGRDSELSAARGHVLRPVLLASKQNDLSARRRPPGVVRAPGVAVLRHDATRVGGWIARSRSESCAAASWLGAVSRRSCELSFARAGSTGVGSVMPCRDVVQTPPRRVRPRTIDPRGVVRHVEVGFHRLLDAAPNDRADQPSQRGA